MSRVIKNSNRPSGYTEVYCTDEPGAGGMCHEYLVAKKDEGLPVAFVGNLATINFQNGPIKENGVNGPQNEDLLMIVVDRLRGAQQGDFSCRENAIALTKLEEALLWLNYRTNTRVHEGVEGKSVQHKGN